LRDIGADFETVPYLAGRCRCPFCSDSGGLITRESHPFALAFQATPLIAYPCMCDNGIFTPLVTRVVERPRSRIQRRNTPDNKKPALPQAQGKRETKPSV
jgi:hypothetical protein